MPPLMTLSEQASSPSISRRLRKPWKKGLPAAGIRPPRFLSCALDANAYPIPRSRWFVSSTAKPVKMPEPSFPQAGCWPPSALASNHDAPFWCSPWRSNPSYSAWPVFDYADGVRSYAVFRNEIHGGLEEHSPSPGAGAEDHAARAQRGKALGHHETDGGN